MSTPPRPAPHPIYHLALRVEHCRVRVSLNALPLVKLAAGEQPRETMPPINPYLVGTNQVFVELMPESPDDEEFASFDRIVLAGNVRRFKKGGPASPSGGELVADLAIPDWVRELDPKQPPIGYGVEFDSPDAPSFAPELVDAPRERDREAVIDYGMRLCGIVGDGDVGRLLQEMDPKIDAYAKAYDEPRLAFQHDLRDYLSGEFLPAGVEVDFPRTQVRAQPVCNGRLWEVTREGQPLLRTEPDDEGSRNQIAIYVGRYEGRLRVAR
jgi:hypothetical protein